MFPFEIMSTFKMIKSHLKKCYYKQNLALVVMSYEMTTCVRSSINVFKNEPHHEKTCFSPMRTTKVQIKLRYLDSIIFLVSISKISRL